jgi:hypothetical protein
MRTKLKILVLIILSSFGVNAQNIIYDFGASTSASLMTSDYDFVLGVGIKLDNRISLRSTNFSLKSSIGHTKYNNTDITESQKKDYDNLWMLDIMLEYDLFYIDKKSLTTITKNWTPYIGVGPNIIYRSNDGGSEFATIKGSLGIKKRLSNNLLFIAEGYLEWDFCDELDGNGNSHPNWKHYDHTANFAIGLCYRFSSTPTK